MRNLRTSPRHRYICQTCVDYKTSCSSVTAAASTLMLKVSHAVGFDAGCERILNEDVERMKMQRPRLLKFEMAAIGKAAQG